MQLVLIYLLDAWIGKEDVVAGQGGSGGFQNFFLLAGMVHIGNSFILMYSYSDWVKYIHRIFRYM